MLAQTSAEALLALYGFSRQPRWRDFDKHLDAEIAAWTERLLQAQDPRQVGLCQGHVLALKDLQKLVRDAPALMQKMGLNAPL
jgi:hypothetical protein